MLEAYSWCSLAWDVSAADACDLLACAVVPRVGETVSDLLGVFDTSGSCRGPFASAGAWPLLKSVMDRFNEARPGASEVRNEVYEANWKGFSEAPWLGHGWPGEPLVASEHVYGTDGGMVVGSHSTVSGLLYKGGIVTFGLFVLALLCTVIGLLRQRSSRWWKNNLIITLGIIYLLRRRITDMVTEGCSHLSEIGASLADSKRASATRHMATGIEDGPTSCADFRSAGSTRKRGWGEAS